MIKGWEIRAATRENCSSGFLTKSSTNWPIHSQKKAESLKFWKLVEDEFHYPCSENKDADQLCSYCMMRLIRYFTEKFYINLLMTYPRDFGHHILIYGLRIVSSVYFLKLSNSLWVPPPSASPLPPVGQNIVKCITCGAHHPIFHSRDQIHQEKPSSDQSLRPSHGGPIATHGYPPQHGQGAASPVT